MDTVIQKVRKRRKEFLKKSAICIILTIISISAFAQSSQVLRVATFNLRQQVDGDGINQWINRTDIVNGLIRFHDFDIFGTQETFTSMRDDILNAGGYSAIGNGRTDGKENGERVSIIYKTDRLDVLEEGQFWFSETPDLPGSKGWDAGYIRMCTWGKFRDKQSGHEFYFFNAHLDHIGPQSRMESAKVFLSKIKTIAGNASFFATGDFNTNDQSPEIQMLVNDGLLNDSRAVSEQPPYGTIGTFNGFKPDKELKSENRIDFIFVSKNIRVKKYGTLNERPNGRFYSDHEAVMIEAAF
jgi:endonuclease/exonuclease/phosphatase family metal-dependent hydrolase